MFDFKLADEEIQSDTPLLKDIKKLVRKTVDLKKFVFEKEELDFDTALLQHHGVIKPVGEKYELNKNELFEYVFLKENCDRLGATISDNVTGLYNLLKAINYHFDNQKFFSGITAFFTRVYTIALQYQKFLGSPQYSDFFSQLDKNNLDYAFWRFLEGFCSLIPGIEMEPGSFLALLRNLYGLFNLYAPGGGYNLIVLNQTLRKFSQEKPEDAEALIALLYKDLDRINAEIAVCLHAGILDVDKTYLSRIKELSSSQENQYIILASIAKVDFSANELSEVFEIIDLTENSTLNLIRLPHFFVNNLNDKAAGKEKIKEDILKRLTDLIISSDMAVVGTALDQIVILDDTAYLHQLLLALITTKHFDEGFISRFDLLLSKYTDAALWFELMVALSRVVHVTKLPLNHTYTFIRNKSAEEFDKVLIAHLIHNEGAVRLLASQILSALSSETGKRHFSIDVLSLNVLDQIKLVTAVLRGFKEPKYTLPYILPICLSKDKKAAEYTIAAIKAYSEDYGGAVTDTIKEAWSGLTGPEKDILESIEKYTEDFWNNLNQKRLKELNPVYTQAGYFDAFRKSYSKYLNRNITQYVEEKSIIRQLAKTVAINKGGGWRIGPTQEISQLTTVGASLTLPRSYFINPDLFEFQRAKELSENWENFKIDEQ